MNSEGHVGGSQSIHFGLRQRLRVPPNLLPPEVLRQGSVSSSNPNRRHYRQTPVGIASLIEICQLRESLSNWSGPLATRLAILDQFSDHFEHLWGSDSGRRLWFFLTEVIMDPNKHRQKSDVRSGFLRKSFGLLGFHLALSMVVMLLTSWKLGGWSLRRHPSGQILGLLVSVAPELFRKLLDEVRKADALHWPLLAVTLQSILFGSCAGLLDPSLVDSFPTHCLLILAQMAVAASFLISDPTIPTTFSAIICALSAVLGDWFGVLGAWFLKCPVDWGGALSAGAFSVLLAAAYVRHHKDVLQRGNPDDYMFVVLQGGQCAILPSVLRQCYRVCGAALQFKVLYYLTVVMMGTIALAVVVLSSDLVKSEEDCLGSTISSPYPNDDDQEEDLTVRVQLPLGISIATTRFGLPRVEYIPPTSAALALGIQVGDVLVGVNGLPLTFATWKQALEARRGVSELRFRRRHSFAPAMRRSVLPNAAAMASQHASDFAASRSVPQPGLPRLVRDAAVAPENSDAGSAPGEARVTSA